LPLLSLSSMALSGCGSELGADRIFSTTVHLTIKPLAEEASLAGNILNVAWVYRPESTTQTQEASGSTTSVDCVSENVQERYCIAPSMEVIARDPLSGQFDVRVGAPLPWLLAASRFTVGIPKVYAVIAICQASTSGSPECIKFAEGLSLYYTRGLGFSLNFKQPSEDQSQPVPSDSELVIDQVRELPRELPKLVLPDPTNF
jgi:hypothetical protein